MRIRVVPETHFPLPDGSEGLQLVRVGVFAYQLKSGDGLVVYSTNDDFTTCDTHLFCEVVSTFPEQHQVVIDIRPHAAVLRPDSHARHRWRRNPYLCLDKAKVVKYEILPLFAAAFDDQTWLNRTLKDCVREIFRPDINVPTLLPVEGYVYLFKSSTHYKIGKSTDPERRRRQVERDIGEPLEIRHTISTNDYMRTEILLHQRYAAQRSHGEWFRLSDSDVDEICAIQEWNHSD